MYVSKNKSEAMNTVDPLGYWLCDKIKQLYLSFPYSTILLIAQTILINLLFRNLFKRDILVRSKDSGKRISNL